MAAEKKALWVVFKPDKLEDLAEMRKKFISGYSIFKEMPGLISKCWWCDSEKGEWGAFYIFNSNEDLQAYIKSDLWINKVPAKYGCKPRIVAILDPGPILSKTTVTHGENSWISE